MAIRIGIDIGGTFTDLQILDEATGALDSLKTPTTPEDPSAGLMAGIDEAARRFGFAIADIRFLLHGTTIATNAVLERKLARGVLLSTEGFTDVLEIGRHARRDIYGLKPHRENALIPRDRRIGVAERVRADGTVERALDEAATVAALAAIGPIRPETVAIVLLNANANPAHERALRDRVLAAFPKLPVSISSEVSPEIREYERSSTTVLNALLIPVVRTYLDRLGERMRGSRHGGAAAARAIQRRRVQPRGRERAAGAAAAVGAERRGSGGQAGGRSARHAGPGRHRHGRHQLRRVRGAGRRCHAHDAGRDRRVARAIADGRDTHCGRGRWLDRVGAGGRTPGRRAA